MANLNQVELEELKDQYRELMRQYGGTNLAGQQTPDGTYGYYTPDFSYGSYKIPYQDPTYSSGYEYARTIAGGMPFEDVVAPGMSFSPDQPMGYTQADLRRKEIYGDFDGVMPVAPTKGTPVEASYETMEYAPVGTPAPEPYVVSTPLTSTTEPRSLLDINTIDPSVSGRPDYDPYLAALEAAAQTQRDVAINPNPYNQLTGNDYSGLFLLDENLANLEEIADKIDMDKVAKIDIEKIDIPESVSLFSDILNEPVSAEPVSTPYRPDGMSNKFAEQLVDKGVDLTDPSSYMYMDLRGGTGPSPGIGEILKMMPKPIQPTPVIPETLLMPQVSTPINFFSDASSPLGATQEAGNYLTLDQINSGKVNINYQPVPESERVVGTKSQTKGGVLQYKIETMADGSKRITNKDGSVTIEPAPLPVSQTPAFVQPNIDEIVRPISRQNKFSTQPPGLFQLA